MQIAAGYWTGRNWTKTLQGSDTSNPVSLESTMMLRALVAGLAPLLSAGCSSGPLEIRSGNVTIERAPDGPGGAVRLVPSKEIVGWEPGAAVLFVGWRLVPAENGYAVDDLRTVTVP